MSGELTYSTLTAATYYALLFNAAGEVWQPTTSTFVTWVDGNIGDYDIPLVLIGGGYYAADMPAAAAGTYRLQLRKQAGGAPDAADTIEADGEIDWSGTAEDTQRTIHLDVTWLRNVAEGDVTLEIPGGGAPFELVVKVKATATELIRKKLYEADGATPITSVSQLVATHLENAP